ncbi:MAG: GNAT family N-acetyltransferase [Pseudonocardiaceae bacterium]
MDGLTLRFAAPSEADEITALTRRSKGHWGYDREVPDRMREMLAVSAEQIRAGHVVVADRDGVLLGYQMGGEPPHGELMDMFLDPSVIGTGLGRKLWDHAARSARERGFHSLTLESDPHAEPFYLSMGAERIGEREVAPGRVLPLMKAILVEVS